MNVEIPPTLKTTELTADQIVAITRAFIQWPFHPDVRRLHRHASV